MNLIQRSILALIAIFALPLSSAVAQESCLEKITTPLSLVSILPENTQETMAHGYQHSTLCPDGNLDCLSEIWRDRINVIPVHEAPDDKAPQAHIIVSISPFALMVRAFVWPHKELSGVPQAFTPDEYVPDPDYGPFVAMTLLEQRGEWHKIAMPHGMKPGWIRLKNANRYDHASGNRVFQSKDGTTMDGEFVILHLDRKTITLGMWDNRHGDSCFDSVENPEGYVPIQKPLGDFYDSNCRLTLKRVFCS